MDWTSNDFAWVIDVVVGALIVVSAYLAMVRGLLREMFALLSWAIAFVAAFALAPLAQPLLGDIPAVGPYLRECPFSMLAAFVIVFGLALMAASIVLWFFGDTIPQHRPGAIRSSDRLYLRGRARLGSGGRDLFAISIFRSGAGSV